MYENVLVPVTEQSGATGGLHHTSAIAQWPDARIQLLFIADRTHDSDLVLEETVGDVLDQEGKRIVEEVGPPLDTHGVAYDTDVVQGNPAPAIVEYAGRYDHDLIVMPTHGREELSQYVLGRLTAKVVRLSDVPVLTARVQPDEAVPCPYESVLVPTDGSPAAMDAAQHGLALAAALDAAVHILSVVDNTSLGLDVRSKTVKQDREQAVADAVVDLVLDAETHGIPAITTSVVYGTPAEEIRSCVESNDMHAIVMGTTGRGGVDRILLGSVAEKTIRSVPVPVITVAQE